MADAATTRIYVRWSGDGRHIRHWSRKPFVHGIDIAQPVDAICLDRQPAIDQIAMDAIRGIADDYMTSETHHPGYVLIPSQKFEQLAAVAAILDR
ncbi:hypothetical protein [uncultured Sphingomonas sp.]|uniref:hypothetical protein n=1 Tax=uncultured Sphingomonas sp. TaxID=158754 RepID=UPI0025D24DCE|nr:hypothetical protein [uncultured Sphingomonas sp.]